MAKELRYDEIGYWSEVKLDIIRKYAAAYSAILSKQLFLKYFYIDAFAGAGIHVSKATGEFVPGSPANALLVEPPFSGYYFIDLDARKAESLVRIAGQREDVRIFHEDCNQVLLEKVLPELRWKDYRRALCILDPYGLHLDWEVISLIGRMRSVEIFLNFPVLDMNRNVLWRKPEDVSLEQVGRMNKFWGDDSWRSVAYTPSKQLPLFGAQEEEKSPNEVIAKAFQKRLMDVAGFKHVPNPLAMRNTQNAVVYYLFFASYNPTAGNIVKWLFDKYANRMGR